MWCWRWRSLRRPRSVLAALATLAIVACMGVFSWPWSEEPSEHAEVIPQPPAEKTMFPINQILELGVSDFSPVPTTLILRAVKEGD